MKALIGVDIGTGGTKAALFADDGTCLAQAFRPSKLYRPRPGVVEEDPEAQFRTVYLTIRQCMKTAGIDKKSVAGIGIDGQMAGVIGVGRNGRNVTPYDSWLDTRCAPFIETMEKAAGEKIVARTGCAPSFNHGPKKLWWMHKRKGVFRNIAAFVQPGGYAAMRLCGLDGSRAFIDKTYLHFSGFADNRRSRWDPDLCRRFNFDASRLPAIVDPAAIVGEVTSEAARRCGLRRGVPVVAGCGDTAASFLACGATAEGIGVDVAGTASVFSVTTGRFLPDVKQRMLTCGQSVIPGLWHAYAYINGGGMNLEWFSREIGSGGRVSGQKPRCLDKLDRLAAKIKPDAALPIFVPHLGGRVCPAQPALRGAWIGVTWDHALEHLYRAVLEGVALEYALYKRGLKGLSRRLSIKEMRVTGGGGQSALWNQLKADAMQTAMRRVSRDEGAPLGAAMLAGHGVGVLENLPKAAKQWVALARKRPPRRSMAPLYARRLARYAAILEHLDNNHS